MKSLHAFFALWTFVVGLAAEESELCDEGLYTDVNGSANVSLVLECNTTHFLWTVVIDTKDPYYYYRYYFGIRCFDANNSQTESRVLENGVSMQPGDYSTLKPLMAHYGWECVLFGCYDHFGQSTKHSVAPAFCTLDEDECSTGSHNCSEGAFCTNTISSYNCSCSDGYVGDGFNCIDVNECQQGSHNCSEYAKCQNIRGGYTCDCSGGYEGDGFNCTDVDECSTEMPCGSDSVCKNVAGSYNCSCIDGYFSSRNHCIDANECESGSHKCSENGVCHNVPGGYNCSCAAGYTGDGFKCTDVNECESGYSKCSENGRCQNIRGGYTCFCAAGYTGDGFNCTRSVDTFKEKLVKTLALLPLIFVVLVILCMTGLIYRTHSRRKQWWLYALKTDWETQDINRDYTPVDPEPSVRLFGSLNSIIEPLQKQNDLVSESVRSSSDKELENVTSRSFCWSHEHRNEIVCNAENDQTQSSVSETSEFPAFQCENPQKSDTETGDSTTIGSGIVQHIHSSFFPKDESGFASDTSSSQYLSFYELCHQI